MNSNDADQTAQRSLISVIVFPFGRKAETFFFQLICLLRISFKIQLSHGVPGNSPICLFCRKVLSGLEKVTKYKRDKVVEKGVLLEQGRS